MSTDLEKVRKLAKDLRKTFPCSPPRKTWRLCNCGSLHRQVQGVFSGQER